MLSVGRIAAFFALCSVTGTAATNLSSAAAAAVAFDRANYVNGLVTEDPFYSILPPNATEATPGTLLKLERQSNTSLFTLPPTSSLSRFVYQSKTMNGSLVPVSGYILWPYTPRKQSDGYAVIAWAHGSSGQTNECAPSHIRNLWQHFLAPFQLSMQGYVVVATDYAGLGVSRDADNKSIVHEFLASPSQANDVVYSVKAAQAAFPELSKEFVVMGHSQGAGAAWSVAQRQVEEPVDGYLGAVAVAPITNVLAGTGPLAPSLAIAMAPGVAATLPGFKTTDITTPESQSALDQLLQVGGCGAMLDAVLVGIPLAQDNWQENAYLQAWQALTENGGREIAGPLLVFHGESDPLINVNLTAAAVNATIEKFPGSQIEFTTLPDVSHVPALQASQPVWMDWIAARFAGESVSNHSTISTACPAKPSAAQQAELNWFVEIATEFFQTP